MHFDGRAFRARRFEQWNSRAYFDPARVFLGQPFVLEVSADGRNLPTETRDIHIASSGSLNVRGSIPTGYIEEIVIDCSRINAFVQDTNVRARTKGKGKGKGNVKGVSAFTPGQSSGLLAFLPLTLLTRTPSA